MKKRNGLLLAGATLASLLALLLGGCDSLPESALLPPRNASDGPLARDANVSAKVKVALLGDTSLKDFDIEVVTQKGDVRLTGQLDSQRRIDHVREIARGVAGVHSIHDELGLRQSGG